MTASSSAPAWTTGTLSPSRCTQTGRRAPGRPRSPAALSSHAGLPQQYFVRAHDRVAARLQYARVLQAFAAFLREQPQPRRLVGFSKKGASHYAAPGARPLHCVVGCSPATARRARTPGDARRARALQARTSRATGCCSARRRPGCHRRRARSPHLLSAAPLWRRSATPVPCWQSLLWEP